MIEKYNQIFLLSWYLGLKYEKVVKMVDFERNWLIQELKNK